VFHNYSSGVVTTSSGCGILINHAVAIVGYSTTFWIVRNSWGPNWGASGYVYIGFDSTTSTSATDGICGINKYVYTVNAYSI